MKVIAWTSSRTVGLNIQWSVTRDKIGIDSKLESLIKCTNSESPGFGYCLPHMGIDSDLDNNHRRTRTGIQYPQLRNRSDSVQLRCHSPPCTFAIDRILLFPRIDRLCWGTKHILWKGSTDESSLTILNSLAASRHRRYPILRTFTLTRADCDAFFNLTIARTYAV